MKCCILHDLLEVQQFETSHWLFPVHTHNHFELILIRAGSGHHTINQNRFAYQAGDVFFLGPLDSHHFVIEEKTCFCTLSFTELYLARMKGIGTVSWLHTKVQGLSACHSLVGSIITDPLEQQNLNALVEIIQTEQTNHEHLVASLIVESLMKMILSLIDRQLNQLLWGVSSSKVAASSLIQRIGTYVCDHITEPDYLRLEKMADIFHYSQSHLGALFKQQVGESIQQYIIRYKLQLIKSRLKQSSMTISQIADEFGFTDICHLNKLFKRHYQTTPTEYRRNQVVPAPFRRTFLQH